MMLNARSNYRSPFTATQWQELEHQALIFKYMVSGVPVPPELLYSVKRSLESSLASSRLVFPYQPIGWGCFQAAGSFGRKADPEPGRCRRTDGKKWRCSKEAYPDSKYCERHMHRGRNRSRKPVELIDTNSTTAKIPISNPVESINNIPPVPANSSYTFSHLSNSSMESEMHYAHQNQNPSNPNSLLNPFLYPHSSSRPPPCGFLESGSSSSSSRYNFHGMREGVDERAFFPEDSRSSTAARRLQDSYQQMAMSNSNRGHSQSQFGRLADASKQQQQPEQHCFVLGADIKLSSACGPMKLEKDADQTQRPLHHFFDEWQPKDADAWLDLSSSSRLHSDD